MGNGHRQNKINVYEILPNCPGRKWELKHKSMNIFKM